MWIVIQWTTERPKRAHPLSRTIPPVRVGWSDLVGTDRFVIRPPVRGPGVVDPWFAKSAAPQRLTKDSRGVGLSRVPRAHGSPPPACPQPR